MAEIDITQQVTNLAAGMKAAMAAEFKGVQVPCSPEDFTAAMRNGGKGISVPSSVSAWITDSVRGLEPLIDSVTSGSSVTVDDATADQLAEEWLATQALLDQARGFLTCLGGLFDKTLERDPQPGTDPNGITDLIAAIVSMPIPSWTSLVPRQLSPADGSTLSNFPREVTLTWQRIPLAARYQLQVECCEDADCTQTLPLVSEAVAGTSTIVSFVGMQPGRWRIAAVNPAGQQTDWSPWWRFIYTV